MDEEELIERDSERDIWQEALNAVRDIKAENVGHVEAVELPPMVEARRKSGLSQPQFAESYPLHVNISVSEVRRSCPRARHGEEE